MMSINKFVVAALSLLAASAVSVEGAGLLDLIQWEDAKKLLDLPELRNEQNNRNCMCKGPACVCCVNFNITLVDLGGPGCVHMKYLSPEDGFSVNVSYGKSLLHSSKIQGANPQPICLDLFSKFAQLCARFSELAPTSDGLRGCLQFEPKLLGDSQLEFPMGCFRSTSGGMEMEEPAESEQEEQATENNTEEPENSNGFDAEAFLLGVYQTAEQGVAFLSSLLDLPNKLNNTKPQTNIETTVTPEETTTPSQSSQRRAPKTLRHPNQL